MRAVRYVYVLALALWLGGMALAGFIVAPTVFSVLDVRSASAGRGLAADVFGEVLRRLYVGGGIAAVVMFLALTLQRVIGPRPKAYGARATIIVLMFAVNGYAGVVLQPRIEALRRPDGAQTAEFDRLHQLSTTLMSLTMLGGLLLLVWESRE